MSLESLKGKKLLILAGAGVHCKVVKAAKELGIYMTIEADGMSDEDDMQLCVIKIDGEWYLNPSM